MQIKFEAMRVDGGICWIAKDETGKARGSILASFSSPSMNRPIGERSLRNGFTMISVRAFNADGSDVTVLETRVQVVKYRADSDKFARTWIRQNDARAKLIAAINAQ
jgi:hypothetical protein